MVLPGAQEAVVRKEEEPSSLSSEEEVPTEIGEEDDAGLAGKDGDPMGDRSRL